jgi:hypothetical protein
VPSLFVEKTWRDDMNEINNTVSDLDKLDQATDTQDKIKEQTIWRHHHRASLQQQLDLDDLDLQLNRFFSKTGLN